MLVLGGGAVSCDEVPLYLENPGRHRVRLIQLSRLAFFQQLPLQTLPPFRAERSNLLKNESGTTYAFRNVGR